MGNARSKGAEERLPLAAGAEASPPHTFGEAVDGGKQRQRGPRTTVGLRIQLHCRGCEARITRRVREVDGVEAVATDLEKDLVTVTGTMDRDALAGYLGAKLGRRVEAISPS